MKGNIAIIDLGSNLTKLVVVSGNLPLRVIHRSVYNTKTLKSASKGFFDDVSIENIEKDIAQILDVAKEYDCVSHLGIATSAFRTRSNGQEVITAVNKKFGIEINIIAGEEEASLIYKGALASVMPKEYPLLVMDIGGGSTEFIIGTENEILWKQSFNFGSTALIQNEVISDPLRQTELQGLQNKLAEFLPPLFEAIEKYAPTTFVGTTGAFESFAQIIEAEKENHFPVQSGYEYEPKALANVLDYLVYSTEKDRKSTPGINQLRVPTIHIAAIILEYVLNQVQFSSYFLSLGDVKEGLALRFLEQNELMAK